MVPNITTNFFMYTNPELDHSWMSQCAGFSVLRQSVNDSNTAEVGVHNVSARPFLPRHPP